MMQGIDTALSAKERLDRYAALFEGTPTDQVCLCGMLAADFASLSDRARPSLQGFFRMHENWLAQFLADRQRAGTLWWPGNPPTGGRSLVEAVQAPLRGTPRLTKQ